MFKTKFTGTGPLDGFVSEVVSLFSILNAQKTLMPTGYSGAAPLFKFENKTGAAALVIDFGGMHVFSKNNVVWDVGLTTGSTIKKATVANGILTIYVRV